MIIRLMDLKATSPSLGTASSHIHLGFLTVFMLSLRQFSNTQIRPRKQGVNQIRTQRNERKLEESQTKETFVQRFMVYKILSHI